DPACLLHIKEEVHGGFCQQKENNYCRRGDCRADNGVQRILVANQRVAVNNFVIATIFGAGGGILTHEPLRDRVLSPAPLTWRGNPRLEGGVRKLSDKAVCRRRVLWAPVLHERYCCSFSGFAVSGAGGIWCRPVLPGIPLYFSISRSLFSQSRICLSFSSWLRICEVLL